MSKKLGPWLLLVAGVLSWCWSIYYGSDGLGSVLAFEICLRHFPSPRVIRFWTVLAGIRKPHLLKKQQ